MDPNATLKMIQGLVNGNGLDKYHVRTLVEIAYGNMDAQDWPLHVVQASEDATHAAEDLIDWTRKGGFAPEWNNYPRADSFVNECIDARGI